MTVTTFDSRTPFQITLSVPAEVVAGEVVLTEQNFVPVGTGAVQSVFGRTGAVVAVALDYAATQVANDSSVVGATVAEALDALAAVDVLKAPLASPTFTGVPAAPTAAGGTSTTQIATTAFVTGGSALRNLSNLAGVSAALGDYADDAAAAIGGVSVGAPYRTGSILKVRVA